APPLFLITSYGTWLSPDPRLRSHAGVQVAGVTPGPRRLADPALSVRALPPLDAVLISHSHMDHCDLGTLRRLPRRTHAVVQESNGDLVRRFRGGSEAARGEDAALDWTRIWGIRVNH